MSEFIKQYGSILVYSLSGILLIGILYGVFRTNWSMHGMVEDSGKTNFTLTMNKGKPYLQVQDMKIKCGEKVDDVRKFVSAKEYDGTNISRSKICVKELEGGKLKGKFGLNTNVPALIRLEYSVTGKNGESVEKKQIILIDEGGKELEISH